MIISNLNLKANLTVRKVDKHTVKQVRLLLNQAFPENEQIPWWWLRLKNYSHKVEFLAFFDQGNFIVFTYIISSHKSHYILYLAVSDKVRSHGYGGKILAFIKAKWPDKALILSIEDPAVNSSNKAQRQARLKFYQRNGFKCVDHYSEKSGQYLVMSTNHYSASAIKQLLSWLAWPFIWLV